MVRLRSPAPYGGFPERPKGADCKSVVNDFAGPNPASPTRKADIHLDVCFSALGDEWIRTGFALQSSGSLFCSAKAHPCGENPASAMFALSCLGVFFLMDVCFSASGDEWIRTGFASQSSGSFFCSAKAHPCGENPASVVLAQFVLGGSLFFVSGDEWFPYRLATDFIQGLRLDLFTKV